MKKPTIIDIPLHQDDRGSVYCAMDFMHDKGIKRTYVVENFVKGMVRCWHGHRKADTYMHVINGAVKLAALDMDSAKLEIAVISDRKPQIFYIPGGWYNGALSLTDNTKIMVYSTLTFKDVKDDDYRAPHTLHGHIWEVKHR